MNVYLFHPHGSSSTLEKSGLVWFIRKNPFYNAAGPINTDGGLTDMAPVISLREVVDAIDSLSDEWEAYLDPDTGEIITVTEEDRRLVEEGDTGDHAPEWQRETLPKIREVLESDRFLLLPDRFDVHEWAVMERFAHTRNGPVQRDILDSLHGSGAFRNFRKTVERCGILDAWYKFRQEALEEIARNWLDEHKIQYK